MTAKTKIGLLCKGKNQGSLYFNSQDQGVFYQLCHLFLAIPALSLAIPALSLAVPALLSSIPALSLAVTGKYDILSWLFNKPRGWLFLVGFGWFLIIMTKSQPNPPLPIAPIDLGIRYV